jgi:hypothetical protein
MIRIICTLLALFIPSLAQAQAVANNTSSGGAQATVTLPAVQGAQYHACIVVGNVTAGSGGVSGAQTLNLRDGATGAGTVLFTQPLGGPASSTTGIALPMDVVGSVNTAMTLEFSGGGSNSAIEAVSLFYRLGASCINPPS